MWYIIQNTWSDGNVLWEEPLYATDCINASKRSILENGTDENGVEKACYKSCDPNESHRLPGNAIEPTIKITFAVDIDSTIEPDIEPSIDPTSTHLWFCDFLISWFCGFVIRFTPIKCCHVAVIIDFAIPRFRDSAVSRFRNFAIPQFYVFAISLFRDCASSRFRDSDFLISRFLGWCRGDQSYTSSEWCRSKFYFILEPTFQSNYRPISDFVILWFALHQSNVATYQV